MSDRDTVGWSEHWDFTYEAFRAIRIAALQSAELLTYEEGRLQVLHDLETTNRDLSENLRNDLYEQITTNEGELRQIEDMVETVKTQGNETSGFLRGIIEIDVNKLIFDGPADREKHMEAKFGEQS